MELETDRKEGQYPQVKTVMNSKEEDNKERKRKEMLIAQLEEGLTDTPPSERTQLITLLEKFNKGFSVTEEERGETDLTEVHINTGDAVPKKQPVRRVPFAVRQEVAKQSQKMLRDGIIQPLRMDHCEYASIIDILTQSRSQTPFLSQGLMTFSTNSEGHGTSQHWISRPDIGR